LYAYVEQMEAHYEHCPKKPRQCKYHPMGCAVEVLYVCCFIDNDRW